MILSDGSILCAFFKICVIKATLMIELARRHEYTDYIRSILSSAGYQNIEVEAWSGELLIGLPGMSPENVARSP